MRLVLLALLAFPVCGVMHKNPPQCSSRPCVYVVECADEICNADEVDELRAALEEAHLGDTIRLQAGRIFPADRSAPINVTARPGTKGYLTITSTEANRLPEPGTRITPGYSALVPWIRVVDQAIPGLRLAGGSAPAQHIRIVGVGFDSTVTDGAQVDYNGPLYVGDHGQGGAWSGPITAPEQQPDDILIERCLFRNPGGVQSIRSMVTLHARSVTLRDSFVDGAYGLNQESQSVRGWNGVGPYVIENNYIGGATENVMFGGANTTYNADLNGVAFRYNYLPKVPERLRFRGWTSNAIVFAGLVLTDSARQTGGFFQAQNSGVTGAAEPFWPETNGGTVSDNDVKWKRVNGRPFTKNNFEIKWARNVNIRYNVLDTDWVGDGSQYQAIIFKAVNQGNGSMCIPVLQGMVNTDGQVVTSADGKPLPRMHSPRELGDHDPFSITINGVEYTIESFDLHAPNQLTLTTSAGVQHEVTYSYGDANCYAAWTKDIDFSNNVVREVPSALTVAQWSNALWDHIGNIKIRDNLFDRVDCQTWSNANDSCGPARQWARFDNLPPGVELRHNTILGTKAPNSLGALHFEGINELWRADDTVILDNIWNKTVMGISGQGTGEGDHTLRLKVCGVDSCPESQWSNNIIAGVDLRRYSAQTGKTHNLCSDQLPCEIDWQASGLFEDFSNGLYRVAAGHFAKGAATDGRDIGADFDQLPLIHNLRIEAADKAALLSYRLSQPIAHIPCVVDVSTSQDLSSVIPDLDPAIYLRPDSDRHDDSVVLGDRRMIRIGKNQELAPNTRYWYRLQCGGDARVGSFTTEPPLTVPRSVSLSHVSHQAGVEAVSVQFGYAYSRSSDTIQQPNRTDPVACVMGTPCTVELSADSSKVLYYRFLYSDTAGGLLHTSPVFFALEAPSRPSPAPEFASEGVLNAASYIGGAVAPCEVVSIMGKGMGPIAGEGATALSLGETLAVELAGVRVLFDGVPAPILYVSDAQINAVVPDAVEGRDEVEVRVEYLGVSSEPVVLPVRQAVPGIFTEPSIAEGQAVALLLPDYSLNGPQNPAPKGSVVVVYGTSGGPMQPRCSAGRIADAVQDFTLPVTSSVGGQAAYVLHGGTLAGSVNGVFQITLEVPKRAPAGETVPLFLKIGDAQSQAGVTIAVQSEAQAPYY